MERLPRNTPTVLLVALLAAAAILTLALTWDQTFIQDTWAFLMERRAITPETVLHPHNEHIVAIPVLIEQLQLRIFGMDTALPEYVLLTALLLVTASLFFVYVKRRVGPWPALLATAVILFLGPAWEVLLWPFEIGFVGAVLFGIATLLALERGDRRGDVGACLFLVLSIGFTSLGLVFAIAAAVAIAQGRRDTWLARGYVVAVPLLLYAAWYLGWATDAETHLTIRNILSAPRFVVEALAVTVGSVTGLSGNPYTDSVEPAWGRPLLIALVIALVYRHWRKPGFFPGLWPAAAGLAAYWVLAAFNYIPGREPTGSRYQYAGAILLLMVLANVFQGERIRGRALAVLALATAFAIGPNLVILKDGRDALHAQSQLTRADTRAIEIARETVDPDFQLTPEIAGTPTLVNIYAGKYLEAVDEYGSPAYSIGELASAPESARAQADVVLADALPIGIDTRLGNGPGPAAAGRCELMAGGGADRGEVRLAPGLTGVRIGPGPEAVLELRRFAVDEYGVEYDVPGGSVTTLRIPPDRASLPWFLRVDSVQPVRVCR